MKSFFVEVGMMTVLARSTSSPFQSILLEMQFVKHYFCLPWFPNNRVTLRDVVWDFPDHRFAHVGAICE